MNKKSQIIVLMVLFFVGSAAFAKAPLQVDFNKMIDEGAVDRAELSKAAPANDQVETAQANSRRKVIDFIDMEVSVGAESNADVVDRN